MSSITVGTLTSTTVNVSGNITMTNGMVLPSFTTAGRPSSPSAGQMIFNTTTTDVEVWTGSTWAPFLGQGLRNWTTSGRPASPVTGDVGWNTDDEIAEIYNGTEWVALGQGSAADPGEVLFVSTGTRTWTVPDGVEAVNVVAIGAGGGGSGDHDGGGGTGGGLGWRNNIAVTPGAGVTVVVGTGGSGGGEGQNGQNGGY